MMASPASTSLPSLAKLFLGDAVDGPGLHRKTSEGVAGGRGRELLQVCSVTNKVLLFSADQTGQGGSGGRQVRFVSFA